MCDSQSGQSEKESPWWLYIRLQRLWRFMVAATRVVFVIVNNLYCIPVHLLWLLLLQPLRLVCSSLYWKIEGIFFRWLLSMVAMWSYSAGYDIVELGDDVWQVSQDRTLVMYNHQSTSDVPLIMAAFNSRPGFSSATVMWIMDRVFRLTNFGVVSLMHGDFFIRAGKTHRESSLLALRQHLASFYQPMDRKWIVLFPEGGFLVNRKPISQKYGQKLGLPHLQNVSLPRSGALKAILDHSWQQGDQGIKWVVDVTVGYPGGVPLNLQALIAAHRPPCKVVMHYRCYTARSIPRDESSLNKWLYDRYIEKERMLSEYYATGVFPDEPSEAYPPPDPLSPLASPGKTVSNVQEIQPCSSATVQDSKQPNLEPQSMCLNRRSAEFDANQCPASEAASASQSKGQDLPNVNSTSGACDSFNKTSSTKSRTLDLNSREIIPDTHEMLSNDPVKSSISRSISRLPNGEEVSDPENNNSPKHVCSGPLDSSIVPPHSSNSDHESPKLTHRGREGTESPSSSLVPDRPTSFDDTREAIPSRTELDRPNLGKLPGVVLKHDPVEFAFRHIFYIVSTYVALRALSSAFSYLTLLCC